MSSPWHDPRTVHDKMSDMPPALNSGQTSYHEFLSPFSPKSASDEKGLILQREALHEDTRAFPGA